MSGAGHAGVPKSYRQRRQAGFRSIADNIEKMTGQFRSSGFSTEEEMRQAWTDAFSLLRKGSYETAVALFIRLSDEGCVGAAYVAANIFAQGPGDVPKDLAKAEEWFEKAVAEEVKKRNADARFNLARIILLRRGESQGRTDGERKTFALRLLAELAAEKDPYAAIYLGAIYMDGSDGVSVDLDRAADLLRIAADSRYIFAVMLLGEIERRRGRRWRAIGLRARAVLSAIPIMCKNLNDSRLVYMHSGIKGAEEKALPDWRGDDEWVRF